MLKRQLQQDQEQALRAKDDITLRTIRSIRAAIQTQEIANRSGGSRASGELDDTAVLAVLVKQAKQRRDSIEQFKKANRDDLVRQEVEELAIIERYLPQQLSEGEIENAVREVLGELGVTDMSGMGRAMGAAMDKLRGKADGKRVQAVVRTLLGS